MWAEGRLSVGVGVRPTPLPAQNFIDQTAALIASEYDNSCTRTSTFRPGAYFVQRSPCTKTKPTITAVDKRAESRCVTPLGIIDVFRLGIVARTGKLNVCKISNEVPVPPNHLSRLLASRFIKSLQ